MENELISVVVPVYNVKNFLNRCIDSIISQTYKIYLVIFHNDENIYEEILLDDAFLISSSPVNLISIPSNRRNINLKSKTYEVEIPLENILLHKESSK
jgi:glycosyltransferase involved in cell wall biosynthesis